MTGDDAPKASSTAWMTLAVVCLVSIVMSLNMNTLTLALPTITRHFEASAVEGSWLLLSFMVTSTACLLLFGQITDLLGQRRLYLAGLSLFTVASIACGLAPSIEVLIGLRVLAAIGAAVMLGNGATLIHQAFPRAYLGHAMGLYTASFSVAALVGPTVGGTIIGLWGWQWVFWFNAPLCVLAIGAGVFLIPRDARRAGHSIDRGGNLVIFVFLVLLIYGISQVSEFGWSSPMVWVPAGLSVALVPVLLLVEHRSPHPVLDPRVFARRGVTGILVSGLLNGAARFPLVTLMSLYFQAVQRLDPLHAGLKILPLPAATLLMSMTLGPLSTRFRPQQLATAGSGLGLVGISGVPASVAWEVGWLLPLSLALVGSGTGLFLGSNATALLGALPRDSLGVGNAVRLTLQNTGNVVSLALALSVLTSAMPVFLRDSVLAATTRSSDTATVTSGFQHAFAFMAAVGVLGFVVSAIGSWRDRRRPQDG